MAEDIRKMLDGGGPKTASGDGAAQKTGYGAGGLGSGADREAGGKPDGWDAPGVTPDGHRTGSSTEGPRIATDGEGEPDAD
jgi:hypothetical protein